MAETSPSDPIPTYQIDLARPPETRYDEISRDFGPRMRSLIGLFDEIMSCVVPFAFLRRVFTMVASLLVRRVYNAEEMKEIKGIASATGVDLYLLVTLNNLLDCLLGCTSGAVLVKPTARKTATRVSDEPRLMHFRTLDWGMDGLRDLLVVLEYVDSRNTGSKVLARSITYAGFVGTLTAIRPNHSCSTRALRHHQLMVLLGRRRSIGSILRSTILDSRPDVTGSTPVLDLKERAQKFSSLRAPPCYIVLCDGDEVAVIEKDLNTGKTRSSKDFIVHTNHDVDHDVEKHPDEYAKASFLGHEEWLEESTNRMECFERKWLRHLHRNQTHATARDASGKVGDLVPHPVTESTLKRWVSSGTTMADCTHFACVMDPKTGQIRWLRRGPTSMSYC
ncbi:beta subunit of N-acylethanolamine-hydrolyzing acid amidase-domain-containing protein [Pestalotiopsis sp. NC0098]|nr:beta subunit of N-acylethanolamine-hydrolyzing acid amidase-domain-containing protein [Pestalotiopsis sp. NC0098]